MKKKMVILSLSLALCMAVSVGCGKDEPVPEEEVQVQEPEEPSQEVTDTGLGEEEEAGNQEISDAPLRIWGEITSASEGEITVDNQSDASSMGEMILIINPEQSLVLDAKEGYPVAADEIEQGKFEAYLGPVMTMSLPPQTVPYVVIVNIEEEAKAPQYAVVEEMAREEDTLMLTATDGRSYRLPSDVEILPYLTRNIVTLDDIAEGSRCLIWLSEDDTAQRVVLFGE